MRDFCILLVFNISNIFSTTSTNIIFSMCLYVYQRKCKRILCFFLGILLLALPASGNSDNDKKLLKLTDISTYDENRYFNGLCDILDSEDADADPALRAKALLNYADYLLKRGYDAVARGCTDEALRIIPDNEILTRASALANLGSIYALEGDSIPRQYFSEALALYKQGNDYRGQMNVILNLAVLADRQHKDNEALKYYRAGIALAHKIGDNEAESKGLCYMSGLLPDDAARESCLQQALAIAGRTDNHKVLCQSYLYLANMAIEQRKLDDAIKYIELVDKYSDAFPPENTMRYEGMNLLTKVYEAQGQFGRALESMSSYNKLRSHALDERLKKVDHYLRQSEQLLALSRRSSGSNRDILLGTTITIGIILLIAVAAYFSARKHIKREREEKATLKKTIVADQQEIHRLRFESTGFALFYANRDLYISHLSTALKDATNFEKAKMQTSLKSIIAYLNQKPQQPKEGWDRRTIDALEALRRMIEKDYPDLSAELLDLAVWLRLGFSTRNISDATGKKTETLSIYRYRLRKVLAIDPKLELYTFLKNEWPDLPYPLIDLRAEGCVGGNEQDK